MAIPGSDPPEDKRSPLRRLFSSRSFIALFITNALAFGGEQMRFAAQSWWILEEGGSKTEMGFAAGLRVIPVVIITPYPGVLIDRLGAKRILAVVQAFLLLLAIITGLILLVDRVQIWHVVVRSTVGGVDDCVRSSLQADARSRSRPKRHIVAGELNEPDRHCRWPYPRTVCRRDLDRCPQRGTGAFWSGSRLQPRFDPIFFDAQQPPCSARQVRFQECSSKVRP